jgi:hypothetical protein
VCLLLGTTAIGTFSLRLLPNASASSKRIISVRFIGGLPMGGTFAAAVRRFGPVQVAGASAKFDSSGCTLRYPRLSLRLWYVGSDALAKGTAETCVHFQGGAVSGDGWRTLRGLRIGDSTRRLRRMYPQVYDTRHAGPKWDTPPGTIEWDITITCCGGGQRPALSAMVEHGRVVAFAVEMVGH